MNKLTWLPALVMIPLLAACNQGIANGDKEVTPEMDNVISTAIVEHNEPKFEKTDEQFEVHKIYGKKEGDGTIDVYLYTLYEGYDLATGDDIQAGASLPAHIQLKEEGNHYTVVKYEEPDDGSTHQSSLESMFPKKLAKKAMKDEGSAAGLDQDMKKKVHAWLEES
ncbi:hypothetical protein ACUMHR_15385 [Rossellomorea marisflavi]|uniref:hypothetical protein n=1 Tax=Rossellomorea marisflavi TaxID=189381 RepID=UPI0040447C5D